MEEKSHRGLIIVNERKIYTKKELLNMMNHAEALGIDYRIETTGQGRKPGLMAELANMGQAKWIMTIFAREEK